MVLMTFKFQIEIEKVGNTLTGPYRYMFDSLRERAAVLDEIICKNTDLLTTRLDVQDIVDIRSTQVIRHFVAIIYFNIILSKGSRPNLDYFNLINKPIKYY